MQAQILNLLKDIQDESGFSYLFIAHNLSVIYHMCDRVAVMYLGKIVELASGDELYQKPQHPYTEALLSAIPAPDPKLEPRHVLLSGEVPSPLDPPAGMLFSSALQARDGGPVEAKSRNSPWFPARKSTSFPVTILNGCNSSLRSISISWVSSRF